MRTTLTVLALVVGASTLSLTTALGAGVSDYVTRQVDALGADDVLVVTAGSAQTGDGPVTYNPTRSTAAGGGAGLPGAGAAASLTDESVAALQRLSGLRDVRPVRSVALDYVQAGSSPRFELSLSPTGAVAQADLAAGRQLDAAGVADGIVLPQDHVAPLGFAGDAQAVGSEVTLAFTDLTGTQRQVPATVVGVSRSGLLSSGAAVGADFLDSLASQQDAGVGSPGRYPAATARFDPATADVAALKEEVGALGLQAQTIEDQLGVVTTVIAGITGILNAFAVVSLVAAAFGIVNTLLMSVQERTREIGLMKALGMAPRRIFALFSLEAGLIGLLGSVIGVALAAAAGTVISAALVAGPLSGLPGLTLLLFRPQAVVLVVVLIVVIAFLAGTLPARRAARQDPITALRYE
nr:ABC transporter permease [Kineococcus siccus]